MKPFLKHLVGFRLAENTLSISLSIPASQREVWLRIADWESQGEWMLQTKVRVTSDKKSGIGTSIAAFTGPLYMLYPRIKTPGLLDLMTVTRWDEPSRCDVVHHGKVLKGSGSFILTEENPRRTRFDWSETIIAPRPIFLLVAPFLYAGVRISLSKFARSFQ